MKQPETAARKEIYRLWYEFYLLALQSTDPTIKDALKSSAPFYAPWGVKKGEAFDDWWKTHSELFHKREKAVRVHEEGETLSDSNLYLVIPRGLPHRTVLNEVTALLQSQDPTARGARRKLPPQHDYAPTEIQGLKADSLRVLLGLMQNVFCDKSLRGKALRDRVVAYFAGDRYKKKQNKVPGQFLGENDHVSRNIRRYRTRGQKLLLNVAFGEFPGTY
jgi:hypothetical protein